MSEHCIRRPGRPALRDDPARLAVAALTDTVARLEQELDDVRNSLANLGAAFEHAQHMAATYAAETETLKVQVSALRAWVKQSEGARDE